jgi:hypothetical protein
MHDLEHDQLVAEQAVVGKRQAQEQGQEREPADRERGPMGA